MIRTIFYTFLVRVVLLHGHYTDLNISEFLSKILLFPEDCTS